MSRVITTVELGKCLTHGWRAWIYANFEAMCTLIDTAYGNDIDNTQNV